MNYIRQRAGLSPLSGISGMELFDEIFDERRRELAFEAQTYYDYVRNGRKMERKEVSVAYSSYTARQYNEMRSADFTENDVSDPIGRDQFE